MPTFQSFPVIDAGATPRDVRFLEVATDVYAPLHALVDADGNIMSTIGGGQQYAEGETAGTPTGTMLVWKGPSDVVKAASTANPIPSQDSVSTAAAGGASVAKLISAASTNATSVKGSPGRLYGLHLTNTSAVSWVYVKLYNKASSPTVGTDVPAAIFALGPGESLPPLNSQGVAFTTGIALAVTGLAADADTTAIAANQVVGTIEYA